LIYNASLSLYTRGLLTLDGVKLKSPFYSPETWMPNRGDRPMLNGVLWVLCSGAT